MLSRLLVALLATARVESWSTEYPLFSISNKRAWNWTDSDVAVVANAFRVSDGIDDSVDPTLLERLHAANPSFKSVSYCNPRGISLEGQMVGLSFSDFEAHHRLETMYYTAGWLNTSLPISASGASEIVLLDHPFKHQTRNQNHCALRDWLLVASNTDANISSVGQSGDVLFVTFIRVDDEVMRLTAVTGAPNRGPSQPPFDVDPPPPAELKIERGFGGTVASSHAAGARVLAPVPLDVGVGPGTTKLQWAVQMAEASGAAGLLATQLLVNNTQEDIAAGFDGAWYDNFGPDLFNAMTLTGCSLRTVELWYSGPGGGEWTVPSFFDAQQARFNATRRANGGIFAVANGYGGFALPNGSCESGGLPPAVECASYANVATAFADGWVDGWILEGFYGNELTPGSCKCQDALRCGTVVPLNAASWLANVQSVAVAAQANPPQAVFPIILQVGCVCQWYSYVR